MTIIVNEERLHGQFDAAVWAEEFVKLATAKPDAPTDEGCMIGWFANAIMVGYDHGRREALDGTANGEMGERYRRQVQFLEILADGGQITVNGVPWREMFERLNAIVTDPVGPEPALS